MNEVQHAGRAMRCAVESGQLSRNSASPRWEGKFQYVGREERHGEILDRFQHVKTKRPIFVKVRVYK